VDTGSGPVEGAPWETWQGINRALVLGGRGLPGDSSLAELLASERGVPLPDMGPRALADKIWSWEQEQFPVRGPRKRTGRRTSRPLTIARILAWADAHHAATGSWPRAYSGPVRDAPFDVTWSAIQSALNRGLRGLPAGESIARLLAEHRDVRPRSQLSLEQVLARADAHHAATGEWPTLESGKVLGSEAENWSLIDNLLRLGQRGLPGGLSVFKMLEKYRGVSDRRSRDRVTVQQILAWADQFHAARGEWPTDKSGTVSGAPDGLTWRAIRAALSKGGRGLPAGTTLVRLLAEHRGVRPALTIEQILSWADAHNAATGRWPTSKSGPVAGAERETWFAINYNLKKGGRGLPGRTSLSRVLAEHRAARNVYSRPPLRLEQILAWADAYHAAHGRWPRRDSGPVEQAPGETWEAIDSAVRYASRGLKRGPSLGRLIVEHRGPDAHNRPPSLTVDQVLAWADAHHAATGRWPTVHAGAVPAAPRESWQKIDQALGKGHRGLPRAGSLFRLLAEYRGRQE
jgi:hypothetical protein